MDRDGVPRHRGFVCCGWVAGLACQRADDGYGCSWLMGISERELAFRMFSPFRVVVYGCVWSQVDGPGDGVWI